MTNELIEAIPSPLWLITKPGGYKHINQFGRVYRTRELALRHCDVNEMVVELRLAPAPEPGAVSPDQSLRGMAVYADEVPPIPAPEASIMKAFANSPRRVPTRDADHCDYPDCEQHWTMVLDRALAAMTKFHATFAPDEEDADLTPRTTSEAFREFVDEHARLLNIRASAPSAAEAETPQSRSLFDMADTLIREMRKQNMWGMRSEYDNWTLRITRNEPGADNLHGGKARLACGCIDICTNQRDHDAHGQKSGEQHRCKGCGAEGEPGSPDFCSADCLENFSNGGQK